jgi:Tol biopolymer transport system component
LSRDGGHVAFTTFNRVLEISAFDFARGSSIRLLDRGPAYLPRWAPDGQRIVFQSNRDGPRNLYSVASDGTGQITRLTNSRTEQYPNSIAPDGTILFAEPRPTSGFDIFRLPISAPQGAAGTTPSDDVLSEATVLVSTSSQEYAANISPNGRYVAYQAAGSDERYAVYVRGYPDANRGPWQISTGGGSAPVWAHSGRELFYLDESNTLMAVPVDTAGPEFSVGRPAKVFDTKYWGNFYSYDVTPDGRFLMLKDIGQSEASIVVVLNWHEELKRLVPTR